MSGDLLVMEPPDVRFRLLGPVEAWTDGNWRTVNPVRSRQILALLLCAQGQLLLTEQIIDALWGGRPPQTPGALVRNYIMRLRRALGGNVIITRSGGYQLDVDPLSVDAVRFERSVHRARQAATPADAEKALEEALSYWRGPALADVRACLTLEQEAARMENLRIEAHQMRAELMLKRGSWAEVVNELYPHTAAHLDRERLCELAMVALAREGRVGEALDLFARFRDYHRTELGLDPGDRIVALHRAVLRGEVASWDISTKHRTHAM
jgi:DNA-binding SARP family transcriptional activator